MEMNSLQLAQAIQGHSQDFSYFVSVARDCKALIRELVSISLCFLKSLGKSSAHSVARASPSTSNEV